MRAREALRHHVTGVVAGADADHVQQVGGPMGQPELLPMTLVDGGEVHTIGDQLVGTAEEVGNSTRLTKKPGQSLTTTRVLAHFRRRPPRWLMVSIGGLLATG